MAMKEPADGGKAELANTVQRASMQLKAAAAITVATGFVAAAASHERGTLLWLLLFDVLKWPLDGNPSGFSAEAFSLNALCGGVMVGWGMTIFLLCGGPLQRAPKSVAQALLGGLLCWFVTDCTGSVVADFPGNVVLNIGFLGMFLVPLTALLRSCPTDLAVDVKDHSH
mmetsp:Transcript_32703/g.61444  ORF Transcript_32703/g.61444 Transcript_32703/m.61444 type:complete len:169 (+) Transcript_32703:73-579(+)